MSGTRYYSAGGSALTMRAGNLAQNVGAMGGVVREFVGAIGELQGAILREVMGGLREAGLPQMSLRHARSCDIPEAACCDPDLGLLLREAHRGETLRMPVRFRNATGKRRSFAVALAGSFRDSQGRTVKSPAVSPARLDLDDGETGQVVIAAAIGEEFAVGAEYSARLILRAEECEDQHLTVTIRVTGEEGPVIRLCCPCDARLRPLRWYHHYYCDPPKRAQQASGTAIRPAG